MSMFDTLSTKDKKTIRMAVTEKLKQYNTLGNLRGVRDLTANEQDFCSSIDTAVDRLPAIEKEVINKRYLSDESEYIKDYQVYTLFLNPPISQMNYAAIRNRAMVKLSLFLNLDTGVEIEL